MQFRFYIGVTVIETIELNSADNSLFRKYIKGSTLLALCDASGAPFTVLLPDPRSLEDVQLIIKKVDSSPNVVTVATRLPSQTIDGSLTEVLSSQWSCALIFPWVKTNQFIVGSRI